MSKEAFLFGEVKERILKGLQIDYLAMVQNRDILLQENELAYNYFQNEEELNDLVNKIIDETKMNLQNSGKVPGPKEVLAIIDLQKARDYAVLHYKSKI